MANGIGGNPPHRGERRRPRDAILCQWSAGRLRRCSQRRTRGTLHLEAVVGVVLLVEVGLASWRLGAVTVSNVLREKVTMMDGPRLRVGQRRSWGMWLRVGWERLGAWLSYVAPCLSHSHSAWAGADVKGHVKFKMPLRLRYVLVLVLWPVPVLRINRLLKNQCAAVASCSCIEHLPAFALVGT
jgi:hypothetical protein